ncbi:aminotransferase class I/II-fold pyridoxal phosphate-dependent enzyme [Novosphingobium panipatense]|uniref:aminotransferase class I/II-fold pyridoxal phosphate-dependent enzyme n=1 Tax=Novosphingobium TaxID=165696 RepID=UPI000CDAA754|nr:aminotransferase class I/II-fold pyridoxal phosphate-dependent enzyme [Novosphingobium sp. HII-3]
MSDACARFGGERADWLDLSTGINPRPWTPPEAMAIDWHALPDPAGLAHLERIAAATFDVDPRLCMAVPGSEAGLRALSSVLRLSGVHQPLCYGTHAEAFPSSPGSSEASVRIVGNPNNPDGAITAREALLDALDRQEALGGWLLVDEAFADCSPQWSIADQVAEDRRLIVTRSFGKFFGLAGVRLGFVLAPPYLLRQLRRVHGEWPVCSAALAFGAAAYGDAAWIAATRAELPKRASQLDTVLQRHGLRPQGACPLFRLVTSNDAQSLFEALARQHILTRPFAKHPRLLRFGLPANDTALQRFDAALARAGIDG